jgi:hypothetical protein
MTHAKRMTVAGISIDCNDAQPLNASMQISVAFDPSKVNEESDAQ